MERDAPKNQLKRCLQTSWCSIVSIVLSVVFVLIELVIIILFLAKPSMFGIDEKERLTPDQRRVLGTITAVVFVEALLLGIFDLSIVYLEIEWLKRRDNRVQDEIDELKKQTKLNMNQQKKVNRLGNAHERLTEKESKLTFNYVAGLLGKLVYFIGGWTLVLLVISNNWLSVGVAIFTAVIYPGIEFWTNYIIDIPSVK
jgi:hypothetical protein